MLLLFLAWNLSKIPLCIVLLVVHFSSAWGWHISLAVQEKKRLMCFSNRLVDWCAHVHATLFFLLLVCLWIGIFICLWHWLLMIFTGCCAAYHFNIRPVLYDGHWLPGKVWDTPRLIICFLFVMAPKSVPGLCEVRSFLMWFQWTEMLPSILVFVHLWREIYYVSNNGVCYCSVNIMSSSCAIVLS